MKLSRREFLTVGGSAVVFLAGGTSTSTADRPHAADGSRLLTPWVGITRDNRVVVLVDKCEMGQGVRDLFARVAATELKVAPEAMLVTDAPVGRKYRNAKFPIPVLRFQITGYSSSTADLWTKVADVAHNAARALRDGAAAMLGVPAENLTLNDGWVMVCGNADQRVTYAEAVGWPRRRETLPRRDCPPTERSRSGEARPRVDARDKVTGRARFGIDVDVAELCEKPLVAMIARPDQADTRCQLSEERLAELSRLPGIVRVFRLDDDRGIAIIADSFWHAHRAQQHAHTWLDRSTSPIDSVWASSDRTLAAYRSEADRHKPLVADSESVIVDQVFETPYGPHAPLEPMTASCRMEGEVFHIWAGTQFPEAARARAAKALRVSEDAVVVHGMLAGGSFGRRIASDFIVEVAQICRELAGRAVKLIWSRHDEFRQDFLRPCAVNRVKARLESRPDGRITEWSHLVGARSPNVAMAREYIATTSFSRVVSLASTMSRPVGRHIVHLDRADPTFAEGISNTVYSIRPSIASLRGPDSPDGWQPRVGYWRSVNFFHTIFAVESALDELAAKARRDPVDLRWRLLGNAPRLRWCLERVKEMAGPGASFEHPESPRPLGRGDIGYGVACFSGWDSCAALAVSVGVVEPTGTPEARVLRALAAVDCGRLLVPDTVSQQVEGGIVFGLSATLKPQIRIVGGIVQAQNFDHCDLLRMHECPEILVTCRPDSPCEVPTGVGELMVPLVAPAVANAVRNLSGQRQSSLPLVLPRVQS